MSALYLFMALAMLAAALFIVGAYVMAGVGPALLTGGGCAAIGAAYLQRGLARV